MLNLKDWMELTDYRISEGSEYSWTEYGENAYCLDYWDQDQDGVSTTVTFDTKTHQVYEVAVHDFKHSKAYRFFTSEANREAHEQEWKNRSSTDEAWDNVNYVDLDVEDDFMEKATAIINYEDYDTRVIMPFECSDADLLSFMKAAHELDITFNEFVMRAVQELIINNTAVKKTDE